MVVLRSPTSQAWVRFLHLALMKIGYYERIFMKNPFETIYEKDSTKVEIMEIYRIGSIIRTTETLGNSISVSSVFVPRMARSSLRRDDYHDKVL